MTDVSAMQSGAETLEVTRDAFLDGRLELLQPKDGPRTAIDAFFLAAATPARKGRGEHVLDAGTGVGAVGLALCARIRDVQVVGVDIQKPLLDLAARNAEINGLSSRFGVFEADIAQSGSEKLFSGWRFDHVAANPPYQDASSSRVSGNAVTARAYSLEEGGLERWVRFLANVVAPGGTLTMIHRADMLAKLLDAMDGRFGALSVYPLFPRHEQPAKRVLVQGIRASRAPLAMLPGMVLHEADGSYTREANDILRNAAALDLVIT